jgi:hypothetical protein
MRFEKHLFINYSHIDMKPLSPDQRPTSCTALGTAGDAFELAEHDRDLGDMEAAG